MTTQITNSKSFVLIIHYEKMESKNELKEIDIKNRTCYYFDDIIFDFDLDNILIEEKSHKIILDYNMSYKSLIDSKPLRNRFN